ncbi:hypothetical protein ABPG72_012060 [Tetrahymena utriculariae]
MMLNVDHTDLNVAIRLYRLIYWTSHPGLSTMRNINPQYSKININKAREEIHLILTEVFARYSCEKREVLEQVFTSTYQPPILKPMRNELIYYYIVIAFAARQRPYNKLRMELDGHRNPNYHSQKFAYDVRSGELMCQFLMSSKNMCRCLSCKMMLY